MRARAALAMTALAALLSACRGQSAPQGAVGQPVQARTYNSFYLWPGVHPPVGAQVETLYLLDGEVRRIAPVGFTRLRPGTPHLPGILLWLVVRCDRLDWDTATRAAILADLTRWQAAGNRVAGLQVDFDAATAGISGYAQFLAQLRQTLPPHWQLSITGLMDWSAHGDPHTLAALRPIVSEVVVQTYQGRSTIPGYDAYFRRMEGFPIPFRVALVENGSWKAPVTLAPHPMFRGYIVFLLRARHIPLANRGGT